MSTLRIPDSGMYTSMLGTKGLVPTNLLSVLAIEPVILPILPVGLRSLAMEDDLLDLPLWGPPASSPFLPNLRKPPLFPISRNMFGLGSWELRPFGSEPVCWSWERREALFARGGMFTVEDRGRSFDTLLSLLRRRDSMKTQEISFNMNKVSLDKNTWVYNFVFKNSGR